MVFLGLEKPVEYGVQQIFDPTMANMVLQTQQHYNEAARAEYERGLKDFDTFITKYGDFISPFAKDMARYGEMVGGIQNTINQAYKDGVDLLRSPEGRMLVRQLTNSIDPREFNTMRTNAKIGFEYLDAIEKAKADGNFNQAYEDWLLRRDNGGPGAFNDFSSAGGAMWNRRGPGVYKDANALVSPYFEDMEDEYIRTSEDGRYDFSGVSRERRVPILQANLGALLNTQNGKYLYELSKQKYAELYGHEPTEEEAVKQFQNDLLDASNRFEYRKRSENKDWARRRESQLRMAEDSHEAAVKYHYDTLALMDEDRDGKVSTEERKKYVSSGGGGNGKDKEKDIVRDSMKNPGTTLQYDPNDPYSAKVTPIDGRIQFMQESKTGEGNMVYIVPNDVASSVIFRLQGDKAVKMERGEMTGDDREDWYNPWSDLKGSKQVDFVPHGKVITLKDEDGNELPYMQGTIYATGEKVLMRVRSNIHDYNKK